jgi:hypothetical protein
MMGIKFMKTLRKKGGSCMSRYGIDLNKVENAFNEVLATGDDKKIAEFAKEVIPLLLEDSSKTRMELVENLLKD